MRVARVFIDTNILLYAHDSRDPEKAAVSKDWLLELASRRIGVVNMQVLNEFTAVLLRKKWYSSVTEAFTAADLYSTLGTTPVTGREVARARQLHASTGYSWWDCILLASAVELGCSHFLSEDLQDAHEMKSHKVEGHKVKGLTIVDPFAHSPGHILHSR